MADPETIEPKVVLHTHHKHDRLVLGIRALTEVQSSKSILKSDGWSQHPHLWVLIFLLLVFAFTLTTSLLRARFHLQISWQVLRCFLSRVLVPLGKLVVWHLYRSEKQEAAAESAHTVIWIGLENIVTSVDAIKFLVWHEGQNNESDSRQWSKHHQKFLIL